MAVIASVIILIFGLVSQHVARLTFFCSKIDTVNLLATFRDAFNLVR